VTEIDPDTREALEVARELIAMGVPVFIARPAYKSGERDWTGGTGNSGYHLPKGWQNSGADPLVIDAWAPGDALCAVMGHGVDLLDIDPRNGGDDSRSALIDEGLWPSVYGAASTPSGGSHEFVANLGIRSRDNVRPGLDVKAGENGGHGFAFIAPTAKRSKSTGEIGAYAWTTKPKAPAADDMTGRAFAAMVESVRNGGASGGRRGARVGLIGEPIEQGAHHDTMRDFIWRYRCRLTQPEVVALANRRASDCVPPTWTPEMTEQEVSLAYQRTPDHGAPYTLTETGNAERCLDTHGNRLRFCAAIGWLRWDGSCWVVCGRGEIQTSVIASAKAALRGASEDSERAWYRSSLSGFNLQQTEKIMRSLPGVQIAASDLDTHPELLAFQNGTVDLRTGVLRHACPEDLLTVAIKANYNPEAKAPKWEAFLASCFPGKPDVVAYLRRLTGYGITGSAEEQIYVVHHGNGANGKSVFTGVLENIFEPITEAVAIESLLARRGGNSASAAAPDIANLRSARLVVTSEAEHGSKLAEARVKALTGGDPITVRTLYKEPFTFTPSFLIMLSTNALPEIRGRDDGIWRRTKVVDWTESFTGENQDKKLKFKLLSEADGIVAWAVAGAVEWYTLGDLGEPESVGSRGNVYKEESDVLAGFFPGRLVADPNGFTSRADVYRHYGDWAADEGMQQNEVWRRASLFSALRDRKVEETVRAGTRGFRVTEVKGAE
jgi:P4 family phage/plasmid primase-like protien